MSSALRKALEVLMALSVEGTKEGLSVKQLSERTGFPPSTVHRFLQVFKEFGMVDQDEETKNYRLGPQLLRMGLQVRGLLDLREAALPVLKELTARTGEDSYLTVAQGKTGVFLERVEGSRPVKVIELVGKEMPLHRGAARKVLLSFMDDGFIGEYLKEVEKGEEPPGPEGLWEEIKKIRKRGYAVTRGDYLDYGFGIAAPVRDFSGAVKASIGIIGVREQLTDEELRHLVEEVKEAARKLSRKLGYYG